MRCVALYKNLRECGYNPLATLALMLNFDRAVQWCERVWYCHHNARVIADFEHRMACVLTTCTSGMSKPYYTIEAMQTEINDYIQQCVEEGIDAWCEDYGVNRQEIENG